MFPTDYQQDIMLLKKVEQIEIKDMNTQKKSQSQDNTASSGKCPVL